MNDKRSTTLGEDGSQNYLSASDIKYLQSCIRGRGTGPSSDFQEIEFSLKSQNSMPDLKGGADREKDAGTKHEIEFLYRRLSEY
jgi:hypothetical protein